MRRDLIQVSQKVMALSSLGDWRNSAYRLVNARKKNFMGILLAVSCPLSSDSLVLRLLGRNFQPCQRPIPQLLASRMGKQSLLRLSRCLIYLILRTSLVVSSFRRCLTVPAV